ncbi:MAG TPA: type II toxin-antitoxin system prevent-host-death family antitoxin [Chloroflexota bacterium]|nr:type II toxin-antitoxin system prevent-host-death family antitoxin [Chloroflexota bacterium]
MPNVDTRDLISISEANKLGVSGLVREAEQGHDQIVLRNNKAVAAVISMDRLDELQQLEDDLMDVSLVLARMMTAGTQRHSLDDVLNQFGYTREQLNETDD